MIHTLLILQTIKLPTKTQILLTQLPLMHKLTTYEMQIYYDYQQQNSHKNLLDFKKTKLSLRIIQPLNKNNTPL